MRIFNVGAEARLGFAGPYFDNHYCVRLQLPNSGLAGWSTTITRPSVSALTA
jgi:hypothetical protein